MSSLFPYLYLRRVEPARQFRAALEADAMPRALRRNSPTSESLLMELNRHGRFHRSYVLDSKIYAALHGLESSIGQTAALRPDLFVQYLQTKRKTGLTYPS